VTSVADRDYITANGGGISEYNFIEYIGASDDSAAAADTDHDLTNGGLLESANKEDALELAHDTSYSPRQQSLSGSWFFHRYSDATILRLHLRAVVGTVTAIS